MVLDSLKLYLQAPYPYLQLVTWEEGKAQRLLRHACQSLSVPLETWNVASEEPVGDLLRRINNASGPRVYLLLDFHPLFANHQLVRALRNLVGVLTRDRATVVFAGPVSRIPAELEKDVLVIDLPLPSEGELRAVLHATISEQARQLPATIVEEMARAAKGLSEMEAYRAFSQVMLSGESALVPGVIDAKRQLLRRTQLVEFWSEPCTLEQVGGLTELKRWLAARADAFSDQARDFGLPYPKGLLLVGVQGCGKSLTAKAIASMWHLPMVRFDFANLYNREFTPEESMREVLKLCESMAPVILWIDELDKTFQAESAGSDTLTRVFGTFITWMQEKQRPVFVVATANQIDHLPPELMRKGRFDEIFFVDLPDLHDRATILAIHLRRLGRDPQEFDLMGLARSCDYFVGAELEQVVISALYRAFQNGAALSQQDLLDAMGEIVPLYFTYEEQIKRLREWAKHRARFAGVDTGLVDLFGAE